MDGSISTAISRRTLRWGFLGRVPYRSAVSLQERARERLLAGEGSEHLFLLEHPHVYTLGRNAQVGDVLAPPEWRAAHGVEVASCDRGGKVTYHGPGQLVGYPVIDLKPDRRDLRRYVRDLSAVLVAVLADFGVAAEAGGRRETIGVWAGERKIASIGVHVSRWVTTHGFALNVANDLSFFAGIVPCGMAGLEVASIASLTGETPSLERVAEAVAHRFADVFERDLRAFAASPVAPATWPTGS